MQTPVENPVTTTGAANVPTSTVPQKATPSTAVTNVLVSNDAKRKLDQVSSTEQKGTNVVQQNTAVDMNHKKQKATAASPPTIQLKVETSKKLCALCHQPEDLIQCRGACQRSFHIACLGIQLSKNSIPTWKCSECQVFLQRHAILPQPQLNTTDNKLVYKALLYLNEQAPNFFHHCASTFVDSFYETSWKFQSNCREWCLQKASIFAQQFTDKYIHQTLQSSHIVPVLQALYSLERLGGQSVLKLKVKKMLETKVNPPFTLLDILGWDPKTSGPEIGTLECSHCKTINNICNMPAVCTSCAKQFKLARAISKWDRYSEALLLAFLSESIGIRIDLKVKDVLPHLNSFRPYIGIEVMDKNQAGLSKEAYYQQMKAILMTFRVLSNFEELQLSAVFFPQELQFLTNMELLKPFLDQKDYFASGVIVQCLKLLGQTQDNRVIQHVMSIFERPDFMAQYSIGTASNHVVPKLLTQFMVCRVIPVMKFRGIGPYSIDCRSILEGWSRGNSSKHRYTSSGIYILNYDQPYHATLKNMYQKMLQPHDENSISSFSKMKLIQFAQWQAKKAKSVTPSSSSNGETSTANETSCAPAWTTSPFAISDLDTFIMSAEEASSNTAPPDMHEVEAIVGVRYNDSKNCEECLVKWKNQPNFENSYEPLEHIQDCLELVAEYKRSCVDKVPLPQLRH